MRWSQNIEKIENETKRKGENDITPCKGENKERKGGELEIERERKQKGMFRKKERGHKEKRKGGRKEQ